MPGKPGPPQCVATCPGTISGGLGTGSNCNVLSPSPSGQQPGRARTSSLIPHMLQWLLMALEATPQKSAA